MCKQSGLPHYMRQLFSHVPRSAVAYLALIPITGTSERPWRLAIVCAGAHGKVLTVTTLIYGKLRKNGDIVIVNVIAKDKYRQTMSRLHKGRNTF